MTFIEKNKCDFLPYPFSMKHQTCCVVHTFSGSRKKWQIFSDVQIWCGIFYRNSLWIWQTGARPGSRLMRGWRRPRLRQQLRASSCPMNVDLDNEQIFLCNQQKLVQRPLSFAWRVLGLLNAFVRVHHNKHL